MGGYFLFSVTRWQEEGNELVFFDFLKKKKKDPKFILKELLDDYELPSFPTSVMRVLEMLRDPDSPLKDIARLIEADPGMHVKVLRTVNSAAYGLSKKIGNIQHAISLLGKNRLESIILPIAVKNAIPKEELYCLRQQDFWRISTQRACLARAIAGILHPVQQAECFTAGLLQDMAIPVLIHVKAQKYCTTLQMWNDDMHTRLEELEKKVFGLDHQTVGALMAERWQFPDYLLRAILYHHSGNDKKEVPKAVTAVSQIRYQLDAQEPDETEYMLCILRESLEIGSASSEKILERARAEAEEFYTLFSS